MSTSTNEDSDLEKKNMQLIKGLPIFIMFKQEVLEEVLEFMPEDDDIIIATYPKTGTTWLQYIVLQILTNCNSFPAFNDVLYKVIPFLEMSGVDAVKALTTRPRVYKHHFPYDMVKKNPRAKVIYVYRKPEDTLVSYYHFMVGIHGNYKLNEFFEDFMSGNVPYGCYFKHVLSYLEHQTDQNLLMVSYEKLKLHTREEILRIARFLGEDHYNKLREDRELLDNVIERTSFKYMKENLMLLLPKDKDEWSTENPVMKEVTFFRKGTIGDGKNTLDEKQLIRLNELVSKAMQGTAILEEWTRD